MAKLGVEQFVDLVKRSGLVDDQRLNQALSGVDQSVNDSGIVASSLTKAGLLTEWQSEKLLQGRHKGFYLGKYKLLSHLGTGGMGAVYLGEHQVMRHRVAIKLLPNHLAANTSYLERFLQEARASAALTHPNIIRAFDVDQQENMHYLVMEYVEGADVQVIVSRNGPLDYQTAATYTKQAAEGLAYAHRVGLIHRDVKPANMLVDKDGTLKILDMGLARFTDDSHGSLTMAYDQKMIGTVDYLAPEQALDSHHVDARADVYSLGCTLYFMLTGDAPFPQGTIPQRLMQHQSAEPKDVRESRPDAPAELLAICQKMMAKKTVDRYQSCDEVAQALAEFLGESGGGSFKSGGSGISNKSLVPDGPSLNENLDLAPIDEELNGRGKPAGESKAPDARVNDSKAGVKPDSKAGKKPSSDVKGPGKSGIKGQSSAGKAPAAKSDAATNKPKSDIKKAPPAPKLPDLSKADELVDELLATPTLPAGEPAGHITLPPIGHGPQEESLASRLGMVAGLGILGAGLVVGLVLFLIWLTTKL